MNKDEVKAIEELEILATYDIESAFSCVFAEKDAKNVFTALNIIKKQKEELEKKDKIINEMAKLMERHGTGRYAFSCIFQKDKCSQNGCKQCIIDYFTKKVEDNNV